MKHRVTRAALSLIAGALACLALPAAAQAQAQREGSAKAEVRTLDDARDIIREARRITSPNGIEELRAVEIGGIKQWISVRGRDRRNPILLFIHGGPASTEMPVNWLYQGAWEDYFTVVQWDQRGAGKTAASNDAAAVTPTITIDRMTADGEELVAHLLQHYGKRKLFVMGHSWGTVIGLNIARAHPEWLHAYIGMGQVINGPENERVGYAFALREARRSGNALAVSELEAIAPYPGPEGSLSLQQLLVQRKWVIYFGGLTAGRTNFDYEQKARLLSPEYTAADHAAGASVGATLVQLLPGLTRLDYRDVTRLDCPIFLVAGRRDFQTPSQIAAAWFAKLRAPAKSLFWFEHSAHMMHLEQPGKLLLHLVRDVRPLAERAGDAAPADRPGVDE